MNNYEILPAVLHIHRFIHSNGHFDFQLLIGEAFPDLTFVPFRSLKYISRELVRSYKVSGAQFVLIDGGRFFSNVR